MFYIKGGNTSIRSNNNNNHNMKSVCKMLNVEELNKTEPKRNKLSAMHKAHCTLHILFNIHWSKNKKIFQCNLIIVIFTLGSLNSTYVQYQKQIVFIQRAYAFFSCCCETLLFVFLAFVCYRMACQHTYFNMDYVSRIHIDYFACFRNWRFRRSVVGFSFFVFSVLFCSALYHNIQYSISMCPYQTTMFMCFHSGIFLTFFFFS